MITYGVIRIRIYTEQVDKMALKKRVEVLFEEEKFLYLERKAKDEKTSVGHLIREAVEVAYLTSQAEKRKEAVASLLAAEYDFGASWEELKEEMAEERYRQSMKSIDEGAIN